MKFNLMITFVIVALQLLASGAMSQEMVSVLVRAPNSPFFSGSGVGGSFQCTKNADESYAICASYSNIAIKYNLQPFAFVAKGPNQDNFMYSCDLFETASQSTSRAVCVKGFAGTNGTVFFHNVSDMTVVTNVTVGITSNSPRLIVDTPNQVAYISNNTNPPAIFKITNIGSSTPIVVATLTSFGSGDTNPTAMLVINGFLFVHLYMIPSRLARINISTFTWNQTVTFTTGENFGAFDNLVNDDNYIYDLTNNGILVRCTYNNNNFARFDSLKSGMDSTPSLAISPDSSFLVLTAGYSGIFVVNTSSFSVGHRALLPNPTSSGYVSTSGRPIILSKNNNTNTYQVCAFTWSNDYLYIFNFSRVPFRDFFPSIYPLPSFPINTLSGVKGTAQCTKNSDESYAVCASFSPNTAIKYNLQPFSFAAKGPNQGSTMYSCDLFETASQSTSRAVCAKNGNPSGTVFFHNVSDMTVITTATIEITGNYPHVIVDTPNQIAYISNCHNTAPAIYKITNIGSASPFVAGNLTTFGSGDDAPAAMLVIDGFLYVHFAMWDPARLARINISTFTWNQTVTFASGAGMGVFDNLANDDNYIYDLTQGGILVRCTYKNNNFATFGSLNTAFSYTYSLGISPDHRTLFVMSYGNSVLQMICASSFSMFGNEATIPATVGRPIITSGSTIFGFPSTSDEVYSFSFNSSKCQTPTYSLTSSAEATESASNTPSISSERTSSFTFSNSQEETSSKSLTVSIVAPPVTSTTITTSSMAVTSSSTAQPPPAPPARNKTKTQSMLFIAPQIAVVAPPAASATASVAAAAGGAVGGDVASPTQAARALSLAAIATACANDVIYVPAPPLDAQLPWPQGSLIPQIQISLPNDDPKDSWRKHFRGAILANFVVFPLIILCIVIPLIYGLRFTALQGKLAAKYLFSVKKSKEVEERAPDLIADARLFGVILFLFGLGLESATCAFVTLLASPRATSDSLGIDIFLCLLAITVIFAAFIFILKIEIGANEKLECVRSEIMFRSEEKKMSEGQRKVIRMLLGSLCWTYRGSLSSEEKIEEAKTFFLRNRNLFASNQGPHEETARNNKNNEIITLATKANTKINEKPNSIARKLSVFGSFVDCCLTVMAGIVRGLTTSGFLPCEAAILVALISQMVVLLWSLLVQPSVFPTTKVLNVLMSFLLFGAALATFRKYKEASAFAVSVAVILSFLGMIMVMVRLGVKMGLGIIIYPKREEMVEEMKQEMHDAQTAALVVPLLDQDNKNNENSHNNENNNNVVENDFSDVELETAPHSRQQTPREVEINIPCAVNDDFEIDLSTLLDHNDNTTEKKENNSNNTDLPKKDVALIENQTNSILDAFVIDEVEVAGSHNEDDLYASLTTSKQKQKSQALTIQNDADCDDEEAAERVRLEKLTSDALAESQDQYESETKEDKLKRLLAELEDDEEVSAALAAKRRKAEEEKRKKQAAMTKEEGAEHLKRIQECLGRKRRAPRTPPPQTKSRAGNISFENDDLDDVDL